MSDPLHFNRLSSWLQDRAQTPYGKELLATAAIADGLELERRQTAAQAWAAARRDDDAPGLGPATDSRPALAHLKRHGVLSGSALFGLSELLCSVAELRRQEADLTAPIADLINALGHYDDETKLLERSVTAQGELADSASAELGRLRAQRLRARRSHSEIANDLRDALDDQGALQDTYVTQRGQRHVLPVKASQKRRFGGVIHDKSRSGKTAFVEPAALLDAGNSVRHADAAVAAEEKRILQQLSAILAPRAAELSEDLGVLAILDADSCRGAFGAHFDGVTPTTTKGQIRLRGLRPPALLLAEVEAVVAIDIELSESAPVLVISGPNGGGKSVALSALGWAVELGRQGIPIPAAEAALPAPPFTLWPVLGDGADDQRAHSTFSGHLDAVHQALKGACEGDLILIDELAGGTEPVAGAAIACGFLEVFAEGGAFVVATTHYDPVKHLALRHQRLRAAAVRDRRDPEVAFRLFRDEVGGSHPIKLAVELGLPEAVIESARAYLDPARRGHLDDLKAEQAAAADFERQRLALRAGQTALEEAKRAWAKERQRNERQRDKAAKRAAAAEAELAALRRGQLLAIDALKEELRDAIRVLRARGDVEGGKEGDRLFDRLAEARAQTTSLALAGASTPAEVLLKPGDKVRLFAGGQVGTVRELRGRTAIVAVKGKIFHLRADQLQRMEDGTETA